MNAMKNGLLALGVVTALAAGDVAAQDNARPERGPAMRGPGVERIMALRERLELTDDQIATLDGIRADMVERRSATRAESDELRSQVRAGQARRSDVMAFMEERSDAREGEAEAMREQIEAVLEPAQIEELEQVRAEARSFQRGRRSARQGVRFRDGFERGARATRGMRGARGARGPRGR